MVSYQWVLTVVPAGYLVLRSTVYTSVYTYPFGSQCSRLKNIPSWFIRPACLPETCTVGSISWSTPLYAEIDIWGVARPRAIAMPRRTVAAIVTYEVTYHRDQLIWALHTLIIYLHVIHPLCCALWSVGISFLTLFVGLWCNKRKRKCDVLHHKSILIKWWRISNTQDYLFLTLIGTVTLIFIPYPGDIDYGIISKRDSNVLPACQRGFYMLTVSRDLFRFNLFLDSCLVSYIILTRMWCSWLLDTKLPTMY